MARIELENMGLKFEVTSRGPLRPQDRLLRRLLPGLCAPAMEVHALRNINLVLNDGDRIGIIGRNGSGKTTLLKVLADIYPPTSGRRRVRGRISSLFDIVLGFEMDATGWENIAYRGYLQGETPRSIRAKIDDVAEFSELGRYLGMPVRYYSAGMRIRLGFAISTAIDPDILLVDEAFNAGDLAFREKARQRIQEVLRKARIVVAVSHDHEVLTSFCDRVVWLDQGQIRAVGPTRPMIAAYEADCCSAARPAA
jgi:ABC-type polysaccharide/polyol phosphate transport system ATPase subunit